MTNQQAIIMGSMIGSVIALLSSLSTAIITNLLQTRRDQFQWQKQKELDHVKWERDRILADDKWERDKILERNKWERDKVLEIYTKCISSLTAYLQSKKSLPPDEFGAREHTYDLELYGQAEAWLTLLFIYHPANETNEYLRFRAEFYILNQSPSQLRLILDAIIMLAKTDSRILAPTPTE